MKKTILLLLGWALLFSQGNSQSVSISGSKFYVNGNEIFFNGINTAWQPQSDWSLDFLGRNFDYNWWNNELQRYKDNHINLARIWIHGRGNYSPSLNGDGMVTGATSLFWSHMDQLVDLASSKGIYIMPTFWSFDMVKTYQSNYYNQYRQIINDVNKTQWYIENFLVPFVQRYQNRPYVMGYDICNEPEHMWRGDTQSMISRNNVIRFIARCAAAINQYTTKPVTVGSKWVIFNSNRYTGWTFYDPHVGNNYSDASLQAQYNNPNAYLDFYSPHWYQWQTAGAPFTHNVGDWLDNANKPVLIGETPGYNLVPNSEHSYNITLANYYKQSYQRGYAGVCAWKNPHEDDGYGYFNSISPATNSFYNDYPHLVYPGSGGCSGSSVGITSNIQAESYCQMSGVATEATTDAGGGLNVGWIDAGDWMAYRVNVPAAGTYTIQYRVASQSGGGNIRLERQGGGATYGTISVPSTGGWQTWTTISHNVQLSAGVQNIAIVAVNGGFNINWFRINSAAASNIAYNRPVTTSSNENTTNTGDKAVDANGTTRWSSAYSNNQNFVVDLGANYSINRIRIAWEDAYARDYQLQVSTNNTTWTTIREQWGKSSAAADDYTGLASTARWVKVYCINRATSYGFSIWEFEVYGTATGARGTAQNGDIQLYSNEEEVEELSATKLWPNPTTGIVTLQIPELFLLNSQLSIHDITGKTIGSKNISYKQEIVDFTKHPAGVYIIQLSNDRKKKVYKVYKQ